MMLTLADLIQPSYKFVVVSGPFPAGKSRFITSFAGQNLGMVDINACISNAAPELFGRLALLDEEALYLIEWRGPLRVERLQEILGSALLGLIVVVDSSQPICFREAHSIFVQPLSGLSVVMAANPRNSAQAWSSEDLRIALRLKEEDVLMTCNATDQRDTARVVLKLTESLPDSALVQKIKIALS